MVLAIVAPGHSGAKPRYAHIQRPRRTRGDSEWLGAFDLDIPGVAFLRDARIVQYHRGGFFTTGNSEVSLGRHRYHKYFDFLHPFSSALALQARIEIAAVIEERLGGLIGDRDELFELDENEQVERYEPSALSFEDSLTIKLRDDLQRYEVRAQFDVVIGGAIKILGLRLGGDRRAPRLVTPSSDHLRERPVTLEPWIEAEIIRRRMEGFDDGPDSAVA